MLGGWYPVGFSCLGGESSSFASPTPGPTVIVQSGSRGRLWNPDWVASAELKLVWKLAAFGQRRGALSVGPLCIAYVQVCGYTARGDGDAMASSDFFAQCPHTRLR